jgi:two-component system, LuxR family, response regulator FixJ
MGSDRRAFLFVVDSDTAILDSLEFSLRLQGFAVHLHQSGAGLLEKSDWPANGCLVIEHSPPESPGLDLMAALRERGVRLPVIIVANAPTPEFERRAAVAGAIQVLAKPLAHNILVAAIREVVAEHSGEA